uniref:ATP synthase subunit a n=1 Tax=Trigonopteryx hopei TaxID=62799 RepID=M4JDH8_9ORTH|nr:ATP synthase F0 subunit 6 [Trigonopteryx hopei]
MTNMFSTFDPSTNMNMSMNWMSTIMSIMMIPPMFWLTSSRLKFMWNTILINLHKEFKMMVSNKKIKGTTMMIITMFVFILMNNFLGLFPYIFTSTSHLTMTLSMALPMWMSFMLFGWINNTKLMFKHLVPMGTPYLLMPFMVMIETISNLIRPGTLAIRLTANMIAGHMLMTLMGNNGSTISINLLAILIFSQMMLLMLESAVTMIQAYVFSVLSMLYSNEVN